MTLETELTSCRNRLSATLADCNTALVNKGVEQGTKFSEIPSLIESIISGASINGNTIYCGEFTPSNTDYNVPVITKSQNSDIYSQVVDIVNGTTYFAAIWLLDNYDTTDFETLWVAYYCNEDSYALARARVSSGTISIDTSTNSTGSNKFNIDNYVSNTGQGVTTTEGSINNCIIFKSNYQFIAGKKYGWIIVGGDSV